MILQTSAIVGAQSTPSTGTCTLCTGGKYSVDPLAGPSDSSPACMTCPAGGDCSSGGYAVKFDVGNWTAESSSGIYRQVQFSYLRLEGRA
jgi:hypothetical protein